MRVGLIGFGKAGKAVASVLLNDPQMRLEWVVRKSEMLEHRSVPEYFGIDSDEPGLIHSASATTIDQLLDHAPVDTIIDFSSEDGVLYYGSTAAARKINLVSAISHYPPERQGLLRRLSEHTAVLWSPNITLGINFLVLAAETLRRIAPETDVEIVEEHFKAKNGVSGTATLISRALGVEESEIKSLRAGGIIGVHEILFGFPYQVVRLRHESISREAFGDGARFAAQKLDGMPPGLYRMEDLLLPYFAMAETMPLPKPRERNRRFAKFNFPKMTAG
jgi:4-hydroxy-tetrahydrodipicolinate reductase